MRRLFLILPILLSGTLDFAQQEQDDLQTARLLYEQAISLMEQGDPNEAISLLNRALQLDPANDYLYEYETAYAHYLKQDFPSAIKILTKLSQHPDCEDLVYQIWGNACDMMHRPKEAMRIYDAGLKRFPDSGKLYMEKGTITAIQGKYNDALQLYQQGINVEPTFPSNYFRSAVFYFMSPVPAWGMIYGEMFMLMESEGDRNEKMSKYLFENYRSHIDFSYDPAQTTFCSDSLFQKTVHELMTMEAKDQEPVFPFEVIYQSTIVNAKPGEKEVTLESLHRIRTKMLDLWMSYPRLLNSIYRSEVVNKAPGWATYLIYMTKLRESGHWEAYNYWLLRMGDPDAFLVWYEKNPQKFAVFVDWFNENDMTVQSPEQLLKYLQPVAAPSASGDKVEPLEQQSAQ